MTITHILVFTLIAFFLAWLVPAKWRPSLFLISSLISVYWLQPASTIRNLDFWLPSLAIFLVVLVWGATQSKFQNPTKENWLPGTIIMIATILFVSLNRYVEPLGFLTASRPPLFVSVVLSILVASALAWIAWHTPRLNRFTCFVLSLLVITLLVIQKTPALSNATSAFLRKYTGQDASLASALDISWLGFSYLAFRLLHAIQDARTGRIGQVSLRDFAIYTLFFPSYTAGPIDRIQRFNSDLGLAATSSKNTIIERLKDYYHTPALETGLKRILVGIFKKFALADTLALVSLNAQNAHQLTQGIWVWIILYAFSLRIYLDFSGYTDIAIGIGNLMGFRLPENFNKPYTKTNLGSFWNSWHITLAQWFRSYFFNPLTRWLRSQPGRYPVWTIVLIAQLGTMLLIGLWHGVTWNFALWGLWHGLGLFLDNRWTNYQRTHPKLLAKINLHNNWYTGASWFLTFHYVTLGWVWFALPDPGQSILIFNKLFSF